MSHARNNTPKSETYSSESIVYELKNHNTQEAARELNRDLHGSKDFNEIYKKANEQINQYNQSHNDKLPPLELVGGDGKATSGKDEAKGIKIGNTIYGTDTVRNNRTIDDKTGNQTVNAGDSTKTLNKNGDEVKTDDKGATTTTYSDANKSKHVDKELGQLVSETKDGRGHTISTAADGTKKTVDDVTHKEIFEYPNGDRKVNRPDGSGCTITRDNGTTKIHSWSKDSQEGNYDVTVQANGDYTKSGKRGWMDSDYTDTGKNYQFQPDE